MAALPWTLAWARLRNHSLRAFTIALSVCLALLALLALQGISHSTGNSLVTYSLSKLPSGERTLTLTSNKVIASPSQYGSINTYLLGHLARLSSGELTPEVVYQEISDIHGLGFYFAGVNSLPTSIHLMAGRMPRRCTPVLCEVIEIGGNDNSSPKVDLFGLKIVGKGIFQNTQLFSGTMARNDRAPILVASGIAAASALPRFADLQGTNAWVGTMDLARIGADGAEAYIASMLAFENQLSIDHPDLTLTWPQEALSQASEQAKGTSGKFALLDFVVSALLLAFFILFSLRHRREHQRFREGLSRIGTPKKVLIAELAVENLVPLVMGAFLALAISPSITFALSIANFHANLLQISQGWPKYLLLLLAILGIASGSLIVGDKGWRRQFWIPYLLGTVSFLAYLELIGTKDVRLLLAPFAYTIIPGLISYDASRIASSLWRKRNHQAYVLFREHLSMWQGVTAILTLATILAMIALSFDSGISKEVITNSRNEVPLDISLKTGSDLVRPLDLGGTVDYANLVPKSQAYAILRSATAMRNQSTVSDTLALIGISPEALRAMPDSSLRKFSYAIAPSHPAIEQGVNVGTSGKIEVTLKNIPNVVDMLAWFRTPRGTHLSAPFSGHGATRSLVLAGTVPAKSSLIAFEFRETSDYLSRRLHAMGEGSFSVPVLKGRGSIASLSFDGQIQLLPNQVWHQENFPYEFNGGRLYVRPSIKEDTPLALVDPISAASATNGMLTLPGAGKDYFQVRIGAVIKAFPSAGDRFVIMDLQQLQFEIGRTDLGAMDPIEVWISTSNSNLYLTKLQAAPYNTLLVAGQQNLAKEFRANPVNVGLSGAYRVAIFYALLLALFMYVSALPLLYKEGQGVLFQLEASGVGPRQLRSALRVALRLSMFVALLVGGGIGLIVGHFFTPSSTPYLSIALVLAASIALSEVGGYLITGRLFNEATTARTQK